MEGLLGFKKSNYKIPTGPVESLLSPEQELVNEVQQEIQQGLLQQSPIENERQLYNKFVKPFEGGFKVDKNDPKDWQGGAKGSGKLIGTNKGVTPTALARHLNVNPRSITREQIKQVDDKVAFDIFQSQYFPRVRNLSNEIKPIAYTLSMLRPAGIRYLQGITDKKQAADAVIENSFGVDMPQKGKNYMKNILGWVNRIRASAGLSKFKDRAQMFKEYPVLKTIPTPKRKPTSRRRM